jgi:serine phosphatase RsbU (regulator of sigma subunit)/Tfp pilus assembly protein PilF
MSRYKGSEQSGSRKNSNSVTVKGDTLEYLKLLVLIFIIFLPYNAHAQNAKIDSLKSILEDLKADTSKVNLLNEMAELVFRTDPVEAIGYGSEAKLLAEKLDYRKGLALAYKNIGLGYYMEGDYWEALRNWEVSLNFYEVINEKQRQANLLSNIGAVYFSIGENAEAVENYLQALKIAEDLNDRTRIATLLLNLGTVYSGQEGSYDTACTYYLRAIEYGEAMGDVHIMGIGTINLGEVYMHKEELDSALYHFEKSLMLLTDPIDITIALNFISGIYSEKGEFQKALTYHQDALEMARRENEQHQTVKILLGLASTYERMDNTHKAIEYLMEAEMLAEENGLHQELSGAYEGLVNCYVKLSDYRNAYQYQAKLNSIKDILYEIEEAQLTKDRDFKLGLLIKEKEVVIADLEHKSVIEELTIRKQKIIILGVIASGFVLLIFAGLLLHRNRYIKRVSSKIEAQRDKIEAQRDKIEAQRDEIEAQRDEVRSQRDLLEKNHDLLVSQKDEIIDSINYALKIQSALMPPEQHLYELLGEAFIFHRPRDIVSGDFYWIKQIDNTIVLAAADCTGHGVPGALMSVLGISYLSEIVMQRRITQANEILNELRIQIKQSLRQHGQPDESRDGIEMALCVIDKNSRTLQYAGANNPLYLIRDEKETPVLTEIKPDRMPLGYYNGKDKTFNNHCIQLEIGDTFYIFSDGYMDQKGGVDNKKYMSKKFKNLLLEIHDRPMHEQKTILDRTITDWMGNNSQIDDILVVGVRV